MLTQKIVFGLSILAGTVAHAATLGTFTFNDSLFGNTLLESDGGTHRNNTWLNVVNANPGNPGALTGANFDTGIANLRYDTIYTIGYSTPIVNRAGDDFGVVVARFGADAFDVEVSTDGITFSNPQLIFPVTGVDTGVTKNYFWGPLSARLFVHPLNLDTFGIGYGASVSAIRIRGRLSYDVDLIRVAGFENAVAAVPEPASMRMMIGGFLALAAVGLWRRVPMRALNPRTRF